MEENNNKDKENPLTLEQFSELIASLRKFTERIEPYQKKIDPSANMVISAILQQMLGEPTTREMTPDEIAQVADTGFGTGLYFGYLLGKQNVLEGD